MSLLLLLVSRIANLTALTHGWATLKGGSTWKAYAKGNTGEASRLDAYVAGLAGGKNPPPPPMSTATGKGLVEIIEGGYGG